MARPTSGRAGGCVGPRGGRFGVDWYDGGGLSLLTFNCENAATGATGAGATALARGAGEDVEFKLISEGSLLTTSSYTS